MDWADRETVLRLLFSKMNTGEAARNWRDHENSSRHPSQATGASQGAGLNDGFRQEQEDGEDEYGGENGDGEYAYDDQYYDQEQVDGQESSGVHTGDGE